MITQLRHLNAHVLIIAVCAGLLSCAGRNTQASPGEIEEAIREQMRIYPASTLADIYKSFFQDAFGPGHLMSNAPDAESAMRTYLEQECRVAARDTNRCPDCEYTGCHGRFCRVNLSVIYDGRVPLELFLSALMRSAGQYDLPDIGEWKREWKGIVAVIDEMQLDLPHRAEDAAAIEEMLEQNRYAMHHSEAYRSAYRPHYRLIERSIFEAELLPLIEGDDSGKQ